MATAMAVALALRFRIIGADGGSTAGEPAPSEDRVLELDGGLEEIRFGRRAGLEIELPFPAIDPLHARMRRDGAAWIVEDLGAVAGIAVDGARVEPRTTAAIAPGQTLRVGHIAILFEGTAAASRAVESTATIARRLVNDLFRATRQGQVPELVALAGPFPGAASGACALRLVETDRSYVVGRGETCDLVLPTDDVSREHAAIVRRWAGVHIRDLGSKNGLTVAGAAIDGEQRLRDGDLIELGSVKFRLDDPEDRYLRGVERPEPEDPGASAPSAPTVPGAKPGPSDAAARELRASRLVTSAALVVAGVVLIGIAVLVLCLVFGR